MDHTLDVCMNQYVSLDSITALSVQSKKASPSVVDAQIRAVAGCSEVVPYMPLSSCRSQSQGRELISIKPGFHEGHIGRLGVVSGKSAMDSLCSPLRVDFAEM